jgi:O-antigen/teichoic acid export membrane protein
MSESLKRKTIKGTAWSFIDNIVGSGIAFLVGLVLARLLAPEEFGLMGMITVFIAVSTSIVDSGFSNALIRKTNIQRIDYNTTFYFNLLVSAVMYGVLYVVAPFISDFFHQSQLVSILRVLAWILIINAFAIVPRTVLVRNVDFKTQTRVSVIASLSSGIIGIGMALTGMGVWSLVGQQLSRQFLNTLFLWIYVHWLPAWEFSVASFKEMFGFGSKLLLSGLINTIYLNIYTVIIGRIYNSAILGQYTQADRFSTIFSSNLTSVVQRVSYPVLSSIQDDPERLRAAYRRVIKTTMLITFACMLGLVAIAKPLIVILIGGKWLPAVQYLQIICFAGMLYPLHAINLNMLQVKGRSDLFLRLEIIKKIIGILPIILGIFCGIEIMLWGGVFTSFISFYLNSCYSARLIGYSTWSQVRDILPAFSVSSVTAGIMWSFSFLPVSLGVLLPLQLLFGFGLAVFIYERLRLEEYVEIKHLLLNGLTKLKNKKNG